MPTWLVLTILVIVFALGATWASRRLLDRSIGVIRALVVSAVVFVIGAPLSLWVLQQADVTDPGGAVRASVPVTLAFGALIVGWLFAIVVGAVTTVEFLWPARGINPITTVRDALRRRDRARRYAQIVAISSRHGLGLYRHHRHGERDDLPRALVGALNEAGVTFVKLGQVLSSREDVLPPDLIRALSTLQMDSTPISWPEAESAIRRELGRPLEEVFASIDEKPLAAASVAQVHAATLRTGESVVVKIQRPSARRQVTTDLDILDRLAADAERRTDWARSYGLRALVAEFSHSLREELDYRTEAAGTELLRGAIARSHAPRLHVPAVYEQYSTKRMLVQERIVGTPFSRLDLDTAPENARAIADGVVDAIFEQIAVRGVFHADLHGGNLVLQPDGVVALVDFGSVGVLERSMRRLLVPLLLAIANEDDLAATDVLLDLCTAPSGNELDRTALQRDIGVVLTRIYNGARDANVFRALVGVLRVHHLAMAPSLLLVFRTLASLEGALRRLTPDYDMVGRGLSRAPHFARLLASPKAVLLSAQTNGALLIEELRHIPRRLDTITHALADGTFSVSLSSSQTPEGRAQFDRVLSHATVTLVGVALVIIGIVLGTADGGPAMTPEVSVFAFVGSGTGLGGVLLLLQSLRAAFRRREVDSREAAGR